MLKGQLKSNTISSNCQASCRASPTHVKQMKNQPQQGKPSTASQAHMNSSLQLANLLEFIIRSQTVFEQYRYDICLQLLKNCRTFKLL